MVGVDLAKIWGLPIRHDAFRFACKHALGDIRLIWQIGIFSGNPND